MRASMKPAPMEQFGRVRGKQLIATGTEKLENVSGSVGKLSHRYKTELGAVTAING